MRIAYFGPSGTFTEMALAQLEEQGVFDGVAERVSADSQPAALAMVREGSVDGAVVPIGVSSALPGVKRLMVLVEKNPSVLSAMFDVSDAVDANFSTRVKMGQSSNVYAVAMMADGKVLYAQKEVKVTLGGCGG